jgi:CRP-like cAMP-binding protein
LLGGDPRASIVVTTETAEILRLPRSRLVELLAGDVFGAKFWKYLACVTSSRLNATQASLSGPPPVPEAISFVVAPEQLARAQSLQSVPSLPALPSPESDPKDELIRKIKARGAFFLGVDVPTNVATPTAAAAAPAAATVAK